MNYRRKDSTDYITNLPVNIIDTILASLPLCDAVRTSVLSREWRNKWKFVPTLVFDYRFYRPPLSKHKLESIIYHVLLQHHGHITKFALHVITYNNHPDIDSWMPLLPSSQLQDFTLHICPGGKQLLSPRFFSFQNLMHLNLYRCVFKPPPQFRGLTRLITVLDFQDVEFVPAAFGQFISLCLLLERVRLVSCTEMDSFEVEAPRLRFFTFHGVFKKIHFKNSPVLVEVSLSIPISVNWETRSFKGFEHFHFLPSLEKLHLHPCVLECMGAEGYRKFPECLNSLKTLNLSMYLDNVDEVASALHLARNSPHLQMLQVSLYASGSVKDVVKFLHALETPDLNLNHIKKVRIGGFSVIGAEIEFVRYVLASAAGLEELLVVARVIHAPMVELLGQLPREAYPAEELLQPACRSRQGLIVINKF